MFAEVKKSQKQPKCPVAGEWWNKDGPSVLKNVGLAVKKNESDLYAMTLRTILQSLNEKNKLQMCTLITTPPLFGSGRRRRRKQLIHVYIHTHICNQYKHRKS